MPTVASVPCRALAIRRDSSAASAGWFGEVQMPGAAAAGAAGGVLAGLGVLPEPGCSPGPEGALAGVLAGAVVAGLGALAAGRGACRGRGARRSRR